jgi:Spy/CpxP family protein refolding chaperone
MKKNAIAPAIVSAILLLGGITACSQTNPPEASPQATTAPASSNPSASPSVNPTASTSSDQSNYNAKDRKKAREERQKQIDAILTPDQAKQLQEKLKQGEKLRKAISGLDLTTEQKTKIQAIFEKSYEQSPNANKPPQ